jgi:predicted Zn-dependent protease
MSRRRDPRPLAVAPRESAVVVTGRTPLWRWITVVSLAVAAAAAIILVASTPRPRDPLPGDGFDPVDPAVRRLLDGNRALVRRNPRSAAAWGDLGLALVAHGHAVDGAACLARAADVDRGDWRWPCFTAAVESDFDLERAAATIVEAIRRGPREEWPRLFRARWLEQLGRPAEAEAVYRGLLADMPSHALAAVGLARTLLAGDRVAESVAVLPPALEHPATRRAAHELLSRIEGRRGDFTAAASAADAARALPPDANWPGDPLAPLLVERRTGKHDLMARTLASYQSGDDGEARKLTAALVAKHPEVAFLLQGRRHLAGGDPVAAERAFRQAVALDPAWVELVYSLGTALAAQGRFAEAATVFREVLAAEPSFTAAWNDLAACLDGTDPGAAAAARAAAERYRGVGKPAAPVDR